MNKLLLVCILLLVLPASCLALPESAAVVRAATQGWDAGEIDSARIDASLAYFADDAVVELVGLPPDQPSTFSGKEQIRSWWEELAAQHFNMTVEILSAEGDTVTTKTRTWTDLTRQAGIAPMEAIEVYVVKDGKIVSEAWTLSEESKAKLIAVMASAPTPELQPDLGELVSAATDGWASDEAGADQIDVMLAYFADDAVFKMVGFPPEIPAEFVGKEAIRAAYEGWLPSHPRLEVDIMRVDGNTVTATTSYWSDPTRAMGVAPLVGTDVYVFEGDKIVSETWTLDDESRQAFATAFAAAMAASAEGE